MGNLKHGNNLQFSDNGKELSEQASAGKKTLNAIFQDMARKQSFFLYCSLKKKIALDTNTPVTLDFTF
jgi:hypothetical protein